MITKETKLTIDLSVISLESNVERIISIKTEETVHIAGDVFMS